MMRLVFQFLMLMLLVLFYQNCGNFEANILQPADSSLDSGTSANDQLPIGTNNPVDNQNSGNTFNSKLILNCDVPSNIAKTELSRMTRKEIALSLIDILGVRTFDDMNMLPTDSYNDKGFANESSIQLLFERDASKYFDFFEKAIDTAIQEKSSKVFTCDINSTSCLQKIIDDISYLAHRGASTVANKIKENLSQYSTASDKLKYSLMSVFLAPDFLFHQSTLENVTNKNLTQMQLADRLASLLWFSNPDKVLLDAAKNNELSTDQQLFAQIDRMIADSKFERFIYNFIDQWLSVEQGKVVLSSNPKANGDVIKGLEDETKALLRHVIDENLPINQLITADYTFLNTLTANYYGQSSVSSQDLQKVSIDSSRRGVFSHASVIAGMSGLGETNPTHRGYWFLKRAFCLPPDPIPGNLMAAVDSVKLDSTLPMKERLAVLSETKLCGDCHVQMDPIGIAFESFDAFGQYRTHNGVHPVDTSGRNIAGVEFNDFPQLVSQLQQSDLYNFESCFSHHMISLARAKISDKNLLCETNKLVTQKNMTFKEIIKNIVSSEYFKK